MQTAPEELISELGRGFLGQTREYGLIFLDPGGRIIGWRGAAPEIFGYQEQEVLGVPGTLIFTPEDTAQGVDQDELATAIVSGRADDNRWHLRKDGTRIWVSGSLEAVRGPGGQLVGLVKVVRDRTDLRAKMAGLEDDLEVARARWSATKQALRTLGHELRNPLAPLATSAAILQRVTEDARVQKVAGIIDTQVATLTRLAEDLVELARAESGAAGLQLERVDLRAVLEEHVAALAPIASQQGVSLRPVLPSKPLPVMADRPRLVQVFHNLIGNALKYTPAGGLIWCKATREGTEAVVRIEDTGIGIPPEVLPRIFDLFTRGSQAAAMQPQGLGVGLSVVYQVVRQHGGTVQARSAGVGKGAEFSVRLPNAGPDGARGPAATPADQEARRAG